MMACLPRNAALPMVVLLAWLFGAGVSPSVAGDQPVRLEKKTDAVVVTIDGQEFTTYHTAKTQMKPYFYPVLAADGANVARALENPEDHPHHKGIWCSVDEVNGIAYWAEKGKIVNAAAELVTPEGNPARMRIVNHWLDADEQPLLIETVDLRIHANRLLVYELEFAAGAKPVTFGDTKEGMFGIRVADSLRGKSGGRISNAEGRQTEKDCWGRESRWVDYVGEVSGRTYGVALFDDPQRNFRKSRFHVRDYGLFTLSPFGQKAYTNGELPEDPYALTAGKSARLRYALYIHDGDTGEGQVAQVYETFAQDP